MSFNFTVLYCTEHMMSLKLSFCCVVTRIQNTRKRNNTFRWRLIFKSTTWSRDRYTLPWNFLFIISNKRQTHAIHTHVTSNRFGKSVCIHFTFDDHLSNVKNELFPMLRYLYYCWSLWKLYFFGEKNKTIQIQKKSLFEESIRKFLFDLVMKNVQRDTAHVRNKSTVSTNAAILTLPNSFKLFELLAQLWCMLT